MMRSLWTAATGMLAQQLNVDVIANNLANVNTTGYKKDRVEFKDLLYETINRAYISNDSNRPVNLQVGHGTVAVATVKNYDAGNLEKTNSNFDFAIEGDAFFVLKGSKDEHIYTKDGSFKLITAVDGSKRLTTSDGYAVIDTNGNEISFNIDLSKIIVDNNGGINYADSVTNSIISTGIKVGMVKFQNAQGLESIGKNSFAKTSASGDPIVDADMGIKSVINQGFLESSNVQVIEEMVKLIIAQKAYEVNSKAIQSSDEMLGIANNLRRG